MTSAEVKTSKRKKPKRKGKKTKKDWRKNIDLTDLENALEKQRLELRTGGLVAEKSDSDLFLLEKDTKSQTLNNLNIPDERLTVDKIVQPNASAVRPAKSVSKLAKAKQKFKEKHRLKRLEKKLLLHILKEPTDDEFNADIWSKDLSEVKQDLFKQNIVERYTEKVRRQIRQNPPKHQKSTFNKTAVEVAHPGASYNPSFEDHQNLLQQAHTKELIRKKKHDKVVRALAVDKNELATAETTLAEMQEGLFDEEVIGEDIENNESSENILTGLKITKSISKKQRRHEARLQKQKNLKNFIRRRENDVRRISNLLEDIQLEKAKQAKAKAKRVAVKKAKRPRLSNFKYEEPDQALKLSDEIQGSLRKLKPEGDVLMDRLKSYQKRCILEPSKKLKSRSRRRKTYKYVERREFKKITEMYDNKQARYTA